MRVMVFDTETTGLAQSRILNKHTVHLFPYIVQLSYIIYDFESNNLEKIRDFIIKVPEGVKISDESVKLHGITNKISFLRGLDIEFAITEFFDDYSSVDLLVAHNMSFDYDMIKAEVIRLIQRTNEEEITLNSNKKSLENIMYNGLYNIINRGNNLYCTMQESVDLCNIQALNKKGEIYVKFPKLVELHEKLFSETPENLHNSLNDVLVTLRCFVKLKNNIDLRSINNEFDILYIRRVE
jgi:DNA polymerase III epsilon subunit-like protein